VLGICTGILMAWVYSTNCIISRRLSEVYFAVVTFWHFLTGTIVGLLYLLGYYLIMGTPSFKIHDSQTYMLIVMLVCIDFLGVNS